MLRPVPFPGYAKCGNVRLQGMEIVKGHGGNVDQYKSPSAYVSVMCVLTSVYCRTNGGKRAFIDVGFNN